MNLLSVSESGTQTEASRKVSYNCIPDSDPISRENDKSMLD